MATIRIAGNTENPCLLALRAKGYRLTLWYHLEGEYRSNYDAEKEGNRFSATSAQELLGLVAMWEVRGDDWKTKPNEPDVFDELATVALTYDDEGNVVKEDD